MSPVISHYMLLMGHLRESILEDKISVEGMHIAYDNAWPAVGMYFRTQ